MEKVTRIFIIVVFKKSKKTWRKGKSRQRSSRTGSSSCQCLMTLSGKRMMRIVFRMPNRPRITQIGHSWVQGRKRSGIEVLLTLKKGNGMVQPTRWCNDSKKLVILYSKSISAFSRGIFKQKKGKTSIHFNGDSMNTELLFQTIHSVNQLSVYGAAANWCYQFGSTEEEKGRASNLVDNKILTVRFTGNLSSPTTGRTHGFDTWITLNISVCTTMRRFFYAVLTKTEPLSQRPGYREAQKEF